MNLYHGSKWRLKDILHPCPVCGDMVEILQDGICYSCEAYKYSDPTLCGDEKEVQDER